MYLCNIKVISARMIDVAQRYNIEVLMAACIPLILFLARNIGMYLFKALFRPNKNPYAVLFFAECMNKKRYHKESN